MNEATTNVDRRASHADDSVEEELVTAGKDDGSLSNGGTATAAAQEEVSDKQSEKHKPSLLKRAVAFYWEQEFLILVVLSILLAKAYPPLGAEYLQPDITATWVAVVLMFFLAGLGLKTEEFKQAFLHLKFNIVVQVFSFGVVSSVVFGVSRGLAAADVLNQNLADGMVICSSLPMTISMVNVITKAAGGDEAAAIFNAAAGNLIGVFLSPLLILGYLGVSGDVNLLDVLYKLVLRVVLPVAVGQLLQQIAIVKNFVIHHKNSLRLAQQYALVYIVYTVFCKTFLNGSDSSIVDVFLMIAFQFLLLTFVMAMAWYTLKVLFPDEPELRVMGLFGCTQKTVAIGVPLINAIYEDNPAVGLYTLPLLIWYPLQLIFGTSLAPRLAAFVKRERTRLSSVTEDDDDEDDDEAPRDTAQVGTAQEDVSVVGEAR